MHLQISESEFIERARNIKLFLMDCDGVLTDGKLYFSAAGEELKVFHVRDGQGIVSWHKAGFVSGIISGRSSRIVEQRANELGIKFVKQGAKNKAVELKEILSESGMSKEETAFIGDDVPDLEIFEQVGLSIAVADAEQQVLNRAMVIAFTKGGCGAVREVVNELLEVKLPSCLK